VDPMIYPDFFSLVIGALA